MITNICCALCEPVSDKYCITNIYKVLKCAAYFKFFLLLLFDINLQHNFKFFNSFNKKKDFDDINSPLSTLVQCGNEGNMRVGGYIVAGGSLQCIQVKMNFIFILVFLISRFWQCMKVKNKTCLLAP